MRIYFSGGGGLDGAPETLISEHAPFVMLSFYGLQSRATRERWRAFREQMRYGRKPRMEAILQRRNELLKRLGRKDARPPERFNEQQRPRPRFGGVFIDSGAYSLYNLHKKDGRSFFNLKAGSEFRRYCDAYAEFLKRYQSEGTLMVNVDVIKDPETTWEVQRYFEEQHGVQPVPVVHFGSPMRFAERYMTAGKYDLLGVGGLGQNAGIRPYMRWADELFRLICPQENNLLPGIKTHGFAMTSWRLMCRWPWWSVDSATWVKLSAFGWVYIPRWNSRTNEWDFKKPPLQVNFSAKSPTRRKRGMHYTTLSLLEKQMVERWLGEIGVEMGELPTHALELEGEYDPERPLANETMTLTGDYAARAKANLLYFRAFEKSRPQWPHALEERGSRRRPGTLGFLS